MVAFDSRRKEIAFLIRLHPVDDAFFAFFPESESLAKCGEKKSCLLWVKCFIRFLTSIFSRVKFLGDVAAVVYECRRAKTSPTVLRRKFSSCGSFSWHSWSFQIKTSLRSDRERDRHSLTSPAHIYLLLLLVSYAAHKGSDHRSKWLNFNSPFCNNPANPFCRANMTRPGPSHSTPTTSDRLPTDIEASIVARLRIRWIFAVPSVAMHSENRMKNEKIFELFASYMLDQHS